MITKIFGSERGELEEIAKEYSLQKEQGLSRLSFLGSIKAGDLKLNDLLLIAKSEDGIFQGIMLYEKIHFANYQDFLSRDAYGKEIKIKISDIIPILDFQPNQYVGKILWIDTFPKLNGTGRTLVESAREDPDIVGMFLHSVPGAKKFYEKLGFKEAKLYRGTSWSSMVWQREEPPKTGIIKTIKNFFYI